MICPRCFADDIGPAVTACPRCGFLLVAAEGSADGGVSAELEQQLRRDLEGQYRIGEMLGRGGMSLVYLAAEIELNRAVALKVLPLQLMQAPGAVERFVREARVAAGLDHPHIVPVFRVGATSTFLWYTMKRIRGRSLAQILHERGKLPLAEVLGIVEQVGSALHHAHRHGVVHRDVKPANVMIEADSGWALVCDFGVARAFGAVQLTQTGGSLGTPRYMSPEQFESRPVDGRSDQYSLAILTFEALTGTVPFTGDSLGELVRKHLLEPPPRLTDVLPGAPAHVSDALDRAMRKKSVDRFPDVAEFVAALGGRARPKAPVGFVTSGEHRVSQPPAPPAGRPRTAIPDEAPTLPLAPRRAVPVWAWVAAAVLVVGTGVAVFRPFGTAPRDAGAELTAGSVGDTSRRQPAAPETTGTAAPQTNSRSRTTGPRATDAGGGPPPALPPGHLWVMSDPPGQVWVDRRFVRSVPVQDLRLTPGTPHLIQVVFDGFQTFDTTITVAANDTVRLTRITLRPITPP